MPQQLTTQYLLAKYDPTKCSQVTTKTH